MIIYNLFMKQFTFGDITYIFTSLNYALIKRKADR